MVKVSGFGHSRPEVLEARDGGQTDVDVIWASEILSILDSSDGA